MVHILQNSLTLKNIGTLSWTPFYHDHSKGKLRLQEPLTAGPTWSWTSYQLILVAVQVMAVVEDILICGVQTGLHTILYHLAGSWRALQFLHLPIKKRNMGPELCSPGWGSSPRTTSKLVQIPSSLHGFLDFALNLNCQDIWWGDCQADPYWSIVFIKITQGTNIWKCGLRDDSCSLTLCQIILIFHISEARSPDQFISYLHPEESDAGQQIHCGL